MFKHAILMITLLSMLTQVSPFPARAHVPPPPEIAVNHQTRQCAMVMLGDGGCITCTLPGGWEILGWERDVQCPAGYQMVELELECKPARELRCCLPGHTGARGDCAGVALDFMLCCSPILLLIAGLVFFIQRLIRRRRKKKVDTSPEA